MYYHSKIKVEFVSQSNLCLDCCHELPDWIEQTIYLHCGGGLQVLISEQSETSITFEIVSQETIKLYQHEIEKDCVEYLTEEIGSEVDSTSSSVSILNKEITAIENVAIQHRIWGRSETSVNPGLEYWQLDEEGNDHQWVDWEAHAEEQRDAEMDWAKEREKYS